MNAQYIMHTFLNCIRLYKYEISNLDFVTENTEMNAQYIVHTFRFVLGPTNTKYPI